MFNTKWRVLVLVLTVTLPAAAVAQGTSSDDERMEGYYNGFIDATIQPVYKKEVCPTKGVDETIKELKTYANAHPTKLSLGPPMRRDQVLAVMKALYPCSATKAMSPH